MLRKILITGLVLFFSLCQQARADWRSYVWTYEYMTMKKGAFELENYLTTVVPDKDIGKANFSYNQILKQEIETGGKTKREYAARVHYKINPGFRLGLESKGDYRDEKYYLGPTVSFASEKI